MNQEATGTETQGTEEIYSEGEQSVQVEEPTQEVEATQEVEPAGQQTQETEEQRQSRRYNDLHKELQTTKRSEQLAIEHRMKIEQENAQLRARIEAGSEPQPPSPGSYQDEFGDVDWDSYNQAQMEHQQKLQQWQQAQYQPPQTNGGAPPVYSPSDPTQHQQPPALDPKYQEWVDKEAAFAVNNPDYHTAVQGIREMVSEDMVDYLINAGEHGPAIAYYMSKNPNEFYQIVGQNRMGQIESMVAIKNKLNVQRRVKTNAPPPPETHSGTGAQAGTPDLSKMSTAEFMRHRNDEERKRRGLIR